MVRSAIRDDRATGVCSPLRLRDRICVGGDPLAGASGASLLAHITEDVRWRGEDTFDLPPFALTATVRALPHLALLRRSVCFHLETLHQGDMPSSNRCVQVACVLRGARRTPTFFPIHVSYLVTFSVLCADEAKAGRPKFSEVRRGGMRMSLRTAVFAFTSSTQRQAKSFRLSIQKVLSTSILDAEI